MKGFVSRGRARVYADCVGGRVERNGCEATATVLQDYSSVVDHFVGVEVGAGCEERSEERSGRVSTEHLSILGLTPVLFLILTWEDEYVGKDRVDCVLALGNA